MFNAFQNKLAQRLSKPFLLLCLELFVSVALTVNFFYLVRTQCAPKADNNVFSAQTFWYLNSHLGRNINAIPVSWRTRLAAPALSAWFLETQITPEKAPGLMRKYPSFGELCLSPEFQNVFGIYHSAWLFLTFVALILFRKDALLIMLGVFAGLMYNLAGPACAYYYPWDMPAMFFFTLACLLYDRGWIWPLLPVIVLGNLFKETTLCCALFILLGNHWTWKRRTAGFLAVVVAAFGANRLLMAHFGIYAQTLAMNNATSVSELFRDTPLLKNLDLLFSLTPFHVIFANAGALLLVLLLPWHNRRDALFRLVAALFVVGQFFYGVINEVRIWYELLPLGWILVSEAIARQRAVFQGDPVTPTSPRLRMGYRLAMGCLLAVILGAFVLERFVPPAGKGRSEEENLPELTAAAEKGDVEAQYKLGLHYENQKDYAAAAPWYERAGGKGHAEAQFNLGVLLCNTRRDYVGATGWFAKAAAQGHADAQYNLAVIYWNALGGTPNPDEAFRWYREAAQRGQMNAQWMLGNIYEKGYGGFQPDLVEAYKWLKLAQIQGYSDARKELKPCLEAMTADQIAEAEKRVKEFVKTTK